MKQSHVFYRRKHKWGDWEKSVVMLHTGESFFNQLTAECFSLIYLGTCFESLMSLAPLTLCNVAPHFPHSCIALICHFHSI